jgi:2'-hydroxyisoflavone reductase
MKILVIGGTRFLGRHLVEAGLRHAHHLTLFHRGQHQAPALTEVEIILGDRNHDLDKLTGQTWDAVIDTCGFLPRSVKASSERLSSSIGVYVFISSQSVYADVSIPGVDETAPLKTLTPEQLEEANAIDDSSGTAYGQLYGGLKALCEQALLQTISDRALIIRPGLIVGPHDYTDRFTYWVMRVARGGEVLAPGPPDRFVQFIDARDLAEWIMSMIERTRSGIYNASGSPGTITMENVLTESNKVNAGSAVFTWVTEDFLLQEKVSAWSEMPLWLPVDAAPHLKGFMFINSGKAFSEGLEPRSLGQITHDLYNWRRTEHFAMAAGMDPEKEKTLLHKWRNVLRSR